MHSSENNPLVSVIIPNYNHESYLIERIESVLNQSYKNFEIIILDDNSNDGSWEIINKYSNNNKVAYIEKNTKNSGSTFYQWRKGVLLAKGDYIWFAESDDVADSSFLDEVMKVFISHDNINLVYTGSNMIDLNSKVIGDLDWWVEDLRDNAWSKNFVMDGNSFISKYHSVRNVVMNASSAVIKKESYLLNEHKNTEYKLCGDWITWIHMIKGSKVGYVNSKLNNYRFHDKTVRANSDKKNIVFKESFKIRSYCYSKFSISSDVLNLIYLETYNNIVGVTSGENLIRKAVNFSYSIMYMLFKDFKFSIGFLKFLFFRKIFIK